MLLLFSIGTFLTNCDVTNRKLYMSLILGLMQKLSLETWAKIKIPKEKLSQKEEKLATKWKKIFQPANKVPSTRLLVEIHNKHKSDLLFPQTVKH